MVIAAMEFVPGRGTAAPSGVGAGQLRNTVMAHPMLLLLLASILHQHHHWMQASVVVEMLERAYAPIPIIVVLSGDIADLVRATAMWLTTEPTQRVVAGVEV